MKLGRIICVVVALIALFDLKVEVYAQSGKHIPQSSKSTSPRIKFDQESFDFGEAEEGIELKHVFKITNVGETKLILYNAYASCGCTVPKLGKTKLTPGESADLTVLVDTSMKQNKVTKEVYVSSNDPQRSLVVLSLAINIADPHKNMTGDIQAKIFAEPRCAACHVYQGTGLYGADLYLADCAMCHGIKAEGKVGPGLLGNYKNPDFNKLMKDVVCYGSKTHRSMPGFLVDAKGPLSKKQIDSIVNYLAKLSETHKRSP